MANRHVDEDPVVLLGEIARDLGVSRGTAYLMARSRELPPVRFAGGRYQAERPAWRRYLKERQRAEAAA